MDPFMTALFGAKEVKATARVKLGAETRTVTFRDTVPSDTSDAAFVDAAKAGGVNLSVRVATGDDRGKMFSGKGVFGAAAASATAAVLGYTATDVPDAVKRRGKNVPVPSANGTPSEHAQS